MEPTERTPRASANERSGSPTLVWIDTREARIVHWDGDEGSIERIESEVPVHRKATGLVRRQPRYDAGLMSGGYGHPHTADDSHRLEHLARFLDQVSARIPPDAPLHVIGPGQVHERLARTVMDADAHHHHRRTVTMEAARRLTDRQLVARARALAGDVPRRRTVGAYRWTGEATERTSGAKSGEPRRVVRKPPDERQEIEAEMAETEMETEAGGAEARPGKAGQATGSRRAPG
jgi:hypothetical protein